jgi:tetratricopeptide (TPR) repeat protein
LITSPRALSRGYAWQDTAAHEYIHLVVAWLSKDQAPVWLQEGLAKYLEKAWRGERIEYLSVHQQSLLAIAVKDDSFVPFEKFARSMAYLDSGDEAALAFAQVATMVAFLQKKAGDQAFPILMDRLAKGETAEEAVASLAGYDSFYNFKSDWKGFIRKMPLVQEQLEAAPIALDGEGGAFSDDPLLSNRVDLAKHVRLGDLLFERMFYDAALIEYAKASKGEDTPSPNILSKEAICLLKMKRKEEAVNKLRKAERLYPEHSVVLSTVANFQETEGQAENAIQTWETVHLINPYQTEMHEALIRLYQKTGNKEQEQEHLEYLNILKTGGAILIKGARNAE